MNTLAIQLKDEVKNELEHNILTYWKDNITDTFTRGFYGRISGDETLHTDAIRGAIMNARILWTFANAYRLFRNSEDLKTATIAKNEIIDRFYDNEYGGIYWSLTHDGIPCDTKKQIYAIAFAIYGLAEFCRATGDEQSLDYAIKLFHCIEGHSNDPVHGGYFEAFNRDWSPIEDMRLSDKDANESKTMNTHLHILEAYTCLYRVWKNPILKTRLSELIEIFISKIIDQAGHLKLFFTEEWECSYDIHSYGHDIEASWLLHEAAIVLEDNDILLRVESIVPKIAVAADEGLRSDGSMIYEKNNASGHIDSDRHWWVQAESVIGYFNLWEHFGDKKALEKSLACWKYIKENLIDKDNGEWFWSICSDGSINRKDDKAGFWKCPYHNGRMCMEIIERLLKTPPSARQKSSL
jgi:mannobiose 2-epimerase